MKNTYKKELMQQCYNDYKSGKPVPVLIQEYNIPRSTLYTWIKRLETTQPKPNYTKKEFLLLQNKIRRLNTIIEILQSVDCSPTAPLQEKLEVLGLNERERNDFIVYWLTKLSGRTGH